MSKKQHTTVDTETGEIQFDVSPEMQWPHNRLHVKTQYNAFQFPKYAESNALPSATIPNQSLTMRTLLERYAKGLPLSGNNSEPQYFQDELMPDINRLDISELHDLKNAVKSDILQKQKDLQQHQAELAKAAHEKSVNDEVEKRVQDKLKKPDPKKE